MENRGLGVHEQSLETTSLDETVADVSQLQLENSFYHRLASVNVCMNTSSHSQHSFSFSHPPSHSLPGENTTEQQQEHLESLTCALQAKEAEIEKLKYDLIVSIFLLPHLQDCSTRLEAERKERREAVMQNTDRLQQLVALQTEMGLERQRSAQDTERLSFLETETLRLTNELQSTQRKCQSLEETNQQATSRIAKLEAESACAKADGLVLTDRVNALTSELEQKSLELQQTGVMLREQQVRIELLTKQLQTRDEEKKLLQEHNEELNRCIQSDVKEKESLQSMITEQQKELEKRSEQEALLRQEIDGFVRIGIIR